MTALEEIDVDRLLSAANSGDCEAQFTLAERFRKRAGLELDLEHACRWYKRAARGHDRS